MNQRGCERAYTWNGFVEMLKSYPLAKTKTYYLSEYYYENHICRKATHTELRGAKIESLSLLNFGNSGKIFVSVFCNIVLIS